MKTNLIQPFSGKPAKYFLKQISKKYRPVPRTFNPVVNTKNEELPTLAELLGPECALEIKGDKFNTIGSFSVWGFWNGVRTCFDSNPRVMEDDFRYRGMYNHREMLHYSAKRIIEEAAEKWLKNKLMLKAKREEYFNNKDKYSKVVEKPIFGTVYSEGDTFKEHTKEVKVFSFYDGKYILGSDNSIANTQNILIVRPTTSRNQKGKVEFVKVSTNDVVKNPLYLKKEESPFFGEFFHIPIIKGARWIDLYNGVCKIYACKSKSIKREDSILLESVSCPLEFNSCYDLQVLCTFNNFKLPKNQKTLKIQLVNKNKVLVFPNEGPEWLAMGMNRSRL